jgi:putative peptidoglycan lipid II flippase
MAQIVVALVAGLPAYVVVKILNPGFFAREDTRTPVWTALASLVFNIAVNLVVVRRFGIVGLAAATAASASLNCLLLYAILHRRGWFHFTVPLASRIARQLAATALMAAALWELLPLLADRYGGSVIDRVWSLAVLVGVGMAVFFAAAFAFGALDKQLLAQLRRRRPRRAAQDDEIPEVR